MLINEFSSKSSIKEEIDLEEKEEKKIRLKNKPSIFYYPEESKEEEENSSSRIQNRKEAFKKTRSHQKF